MKLFPRIVYSAAHILDCLIHIRLQLLPLTVVRRFHLSESGSYHLSFVIELFNQCLTIGLDPVLPAINL